ncbi:hemerythrin domain-containing protein [Flexivirga oryzae]|uniref:Hemerythrin-like domain-containing protein n=1 Tax=Flexivirga oryzae TaxID=1794944 RepID=A0A839MZY6_9MICO|nr:hemerythrin domain-containing protein [Flexivirga oryzae]MBB2890677.1 hypothetical protein [Flexivirga oryzae]
MRRTHAALRKALEAARSPGAALGDQELLLHCRGFCSALEKHHQGEELILFPALEATHPELATVLRALVEDHGLIAELLSAMGEALASDAPVVELERQLDGIGAIMESHFRYEERQLLGVLDTLELRADVGEVFGPVEVAGDIP